MTRAGPDTEPARSGVTKQTRAPEWSRMYSASFGWSFALTGTTASPAHHAAQRISTYSGEFVISSPTRSPGSRRSAVRSADAIAAQRRASVP